MTQKPTVTVRCVANQYAAPNERIIEISGRHGAGALISIIENDDGLNVYVYRCERTAVSTNTTQLPVTP